MRIYFVPLVKGMVEIYYLMGGGGGGGDLSSFLVRFSGFFGSMSNLC